jgi:glycosyltransferase involved in cell wall biosynthesis|tara:strand:- start:1541 stop:2449 length:909 start_codon:yes stop_codon:yes gene_type:complete
MKTENNVIIHVCVKDRPTELFGLLQSLRTQTYQNFNILILDDGSSTRLDSHYFIQYIINRMTLEGHEIKVIRNELPSGVSMARQTLVDYSLKNGKEEFICRLDDDVLVESDYIEKLFEVLNEGYDLASGITTPIMQPEWKRDVKYVTPLIGECRLDEEGNLIMNGDDCGYGYYERAIIPAHHFRSCALYKKEIHESGADYNSRLTKHGFREEQLFSFKVIINGYKIGVHTQANALHLCCPSGGERSTTNLTDCNQEIFEDSVKKMFEKHGNFLEDYNKKLGIKTREVDETELLKATNLVSKR